MRSVKDIQRDIRELKSQMRALGVRVSSCFNGGHTMESLRYNSCLFALKAELKKAQKEDKS